MKITERLNVLRELMKEKKIDAYLVPTDDFHGSEYVGDYFKCRKYITGFTGSAGTAVIMQDMAGLWTDGRYFIQAADQLRGSTIELFRSGEPGVPTVHQFLAEKLEKSMCLGFDGRTVSAKEAEELEKLLEEKNITFAVNEDLIGEIWRERPALSCEPVMELDVKWAGESRKDKIAGIREQMKAKKANIFILTSLDDIAWLLNIRGNDIHCCPVVLSYLIMTDTEVRLYANAAAFSEEICTNLADDGVKIYPYEDVYSYVQTISGDKKILLSKANVNSRLVSSIPSGAKLLDEPNLTLLPKAVKNQTEMDNERTAHIKDGVAVTKFIRWMKTNVAKERITELGAAEKLYQFRSEQEHFIGDSFDPIIAYGKHAAIVHYSATEETDIPLEARGMVLADTGGHYLEGTTDITRTIVLGPVTEKEKKYFTAVLRGNLNLAAAKFKYGCTGLNLDYLARSPLWELGEDYNHGTGHGVGYLLNVHEGPNSFRWKNLPGNPAPVLEEGMITSDEPGYYLENEFGIRHENLVLCKKAEKTPFGQFMCFESLTMVPFDLDGVDTEQ
ncbi:MAG: aminopeptidase P family N-terminal domain-containing protein, partial [Blautia sp.]